MTTLLIVDDSRLARALVSEVATSIGFQVIGEAADGEEGVEQYKQLNPDVMTIDLEMPKLNGLSAASIILTKRPEANIIMITSIVDKKKTMMALKKGVKKVLTKPINADELTDALKAVIT